MPSDEELAQHLIEELELELAEHVRLAQARVAEHTRQLNALAGLLREHHERYYSHESSSREGQNGLKNR